VPRVIGIDPGTITIDLCGLDDGRVFLEQSFPTAAALADPSFLVGVLERAAPLDLVAGPSGYGLPLTPIGEVTEADLRLAFLPDLSASGGVLGLRTLARALARSPVPIVLTPGVVHLPSVPAHRKINRIDMGTADKVCAAALAVHEQCERDRCEPRDVSLILLELGGAFTAAIAVEDGRIVDGLGGTSGPMGLRAAGALDGEVAFLAGTVTKGHLFGGGVATTAGTPDASPEALAAPTTAGGRTAWEAYVEGALKSVAALAVSAPNAREVILSGRVARIDSVREELARRIAALMPRAAVVRTLAGFGGSAKQAAQGAAVIADGLAGGRFASIVETLGVREASGTVLDHLSVISPAAARSALGLDA
jgi:predicted butyrate kinase (DUF1464 family)